MFCLLMSEEGIGNPGTGAADSHEARAAGVKLGSFKGETSALNLWANSPS